MYHCTFFFQQPCKTELSCQNQGLESLFINVLFSAFFLAYARAYEFVAYTNCFYKCVLQRNSLQYVCCAW